MNEFRVNSYSLLPPVVKNLLIINAIFYLATVVFQMRGWDLVALFGLHNFSHPESHFWQPITHIFMHGSFSHIFFNMFALWMFGSALENTWGQKKFLTYYLVCGIGAGLIHILVNFIRIYLLSKNLSPDAIQLVAKDGYQLLSEGKNFKNEIMGALNLATNAPAVGASGAVFGLLLAFGMMYPNSLIYVYFLLPIKAKWFVMIYGAIELVTGVLGTNDGVGHFAHLGGMLFGFFMILYWNKGNRYFHFDLSKWKKKKQYKYAGSSNYQYENKPFTDEEHNLLKKKNQERIDGILEKISKNGYESLSKEEKDFLFHQRK